MARLRSLRLLGRKELSVSCWKVKNSADPLQACGCAVATVVADFDTCAVGSSRRSRSTYFCFCTNVDPGDGVSWAHPRLKMPLPIYVVAQTRSFARDLIILPE